MKQKEKKKTDLPTWVVFPSVRPILLPKPRAPIHVTDAWVPFVDQSSRIATNHVLR
jgi:hypothetical protein